MANAFQKAIKTNQNPATSTKKKASSKAYVSVSDEVKEAVDNFVAAKKAKKQAEADMKFNETTIIDAVKEIQDKDGFTNQYASSYDVQGNTEDVKYVTQNRASVSIDDQDKIEKLLGNDYDSLIQENVTVSLKSEVFDDDAKQEELMNLLGEEKFAEFFEVDTKLAIKEGFNKAIYTVVKKQDKLDEVRTFVKPYKAAVRG